MLYISRSTIPLPYHKAACRKVPFNPGLFLEIPFEVIDGFQYDIFIFLGDDAAVLEDEVIRIDGEQLFDIVRHDFSINHRWGR